MFKWNTNIGNRATGKYKLFMIVYSRFFVLVSFTRWPMFLKCLTFLTIFFPYLYSILSFLWLSAQLMMKCLCMRYFFWLLCVWFYVHLGLHLLDYQFTTVEKEVAHHIQEWTFNGLENYAHIMSCYPLTYYTVHISLFCVIIIC